MGLEEEIDADMSVSEMDLAAAAGEEAQEKAEHTCESIMDEMGHTILPLRDDLTQQNIMRGAYHQHIANLENEIVILKRKLGLSVNGTY